MHHLRLIMQQSFGSATTSRESITAAHSDTRHRDYRFFFSSFRPSFHALCMCETHIHVVVRVYAREERI